MPCDTAGLGSSPFARRYLENRVYFLFLQVLRCFSSLRSPHAQHDVRIAPDGLPHSEIHGSKGICPSPWLIAAYHVLRRLREPRHPPYALLVPYFSFLHPHCACAQVVNLFSYQNLKFDNLFAFGFARYETLCVSTRFLSL